MGYSAAQAVEDVVAAPPILDAHLDLGMYLRQERQKGRRQVFASDFLQDARESGVRGIVAAIFTDEQSINGSALQQACDQIAALQAEMCESPGQMKLCMTYADLMEAAASGQIAILLSFEGIEPLGGNAELLDFFYRVGVRGIGLAHARRNRACDGAYYTANRHNIGGGLTEFGVQLILRAEELGMLIDVSHLNDLGMADVFSVTKCPIIASHSNCRSLNPTLRNLTDEQIRTIADRGGVVGVNGCSAVIGDGPDNANLEMLVRHIEHLVQVGGIDRVGIGLDMAERIMPGAYITVNGYRQKVADIIPSYSALGRLLSQLRRRGFTDDMLEKFCAANFFRVYREVLAP